MNQLIVILLRPADQISRIAPCRNYERFLVWTQYPLNLKKLIVFFTTLEGGARCFILRLNGKIAPHRLAAFFIRKRTKPLFANIRPIRGKSTSPETDE